MKTFICKGRCYGEDYKIIYLVAKDYNEAAYIVDDWFDDVVFLYEVI